VVDTVALEKDFVPVLQVFPVTIVQPMVHIYPTITDFIQYYQLTGSLHNTHKKEMTRQHLSHPEEMSNSQII
jgi:hypothetical protein